MAPFQIIFAAFLLISIANGELYNNQSWNSLLRADLFPVQFGTEILGSGATSSTILTQLKTLLGNPTLLSQVYGKYLVEYNKGNRKSETAFVKNVLSIVEHNLAYEADLKSWDKGVNHFTDMTSEELEGYACGKTSQQSNVTLDPQVETTLRQLRAPDSVDYVKQGIVTPIKHQGSCGTCWAFASIATLESKLKSMNREIILSEQEMLDCDRKEMGCRGGWIEKATDYLKQYGVVTSAEYPYTGTQGSCQRNGKKPAGQIGSYSKVYGEDRIRDALAQYGVLSVGVTIGDDWHQYKSGIYEGACGRGGHFIAVVGYGTSDKKKDYWLIKNSWGTKWGIKGYMQMVRGRDMCGIGSRNGGWFITSMN